MESQKEEYPTNICLKLEGLSPKCLDPDTSKSSISYLESDRCRFNSLPMGLVFGSLVLGGREVEKRKGGEVATVKF